MRIEITLADGARPPEYKTAGASAFDIEAFLPNEKGGRILLRPGEKRIIPTGLRMAIPHGYELQIRPRSGTSLKTNLRISNSPGTIDSDYRGEIGIIVQNIGETEEIVSNYERIAQGAICPVLQAEFTVVETLDETQRGEGGFGSTGK